MKKHLQFIFLILIFISCKEKTSKQINTSESEVEQTVTKQVEWKSLVEKLLDKCKYYETYEKSINFIPEIKIINLKSKEEKIIKENIVIDNYNYLYFKCFNDGVTVFFKPLDSKKIVFGLVNCDGKIVLNPEYDYIDYYPDNGYWQVKKDGKWYLFKEGKGLLDPLTYLDFSEVIK